MENKKNKKKLFAIIGASALAFILTVALSVSITLAYFGDKKDSTAATITMGQAVTFDGDVTVTADVQTVLPGATGNLSINGKIAKSKTTAYLRLKVTTNEGADANIKLADELTTADDSAIKGTLTKHTDGYYYLVNEGNVVVISSADAAKDIKVKGTYSVNKDLTNAVASTATETKTVSVTITMEIIQSEYIAADATLTNVATAWATAKV